MYSYSFYIIAAFSFTGFILLLLAAQVFFKYRSTKENFHPLDLDKDEA